MSRFNGRNNNVIKYALCIVILLVWPSHYTICFATRNRHYLRDRKLDTPHTPGVNTREGSASALLAENGGGITEDGKGSSTFNVLKYGAKGDGVSDDTKAFEAAWEAACKVERSTMLVPSGSTFLVKPISFSGPNCASNIVFRLDGKIIAPTSAGAWGSGLLQWLEFTKLKGITITGKGIIDGQGSVWWKKSSTEEEDEEEEFQAAVQDISSDNNNNAIINNSTSEDYEVDTDGRKMPSTKPTALRFYGSSDVTVTGITIQNSPQAHLKFDNCVRVQVFSFSVSSPEDSPNTDGIHLQNSQDVVIHSTTLACGDDCISIQTGCSGVYVHNVNCGPGHGFSIGGLGKAGSKACVSNITIRDSSLHNTANGVRIKTWQGGSGSVQGVMFSNIQVSQVRTPIIIDQYYCNTAASGTCQNKSSAVAVSAISYQSIKGTYTQQPVHFACSDSLPCSGITLSTIELNPVKEEKTHMYEPFCWQTYGELKTATTPPITCLKKQQQAGSHRPALKPSHNTVDSC